MEYEIKKRSHYTIMDGVVITYSTNFIDDRDDPFSKRSIAIGPFEVSASRNAVVVHKATITTVYQMELFKTALTLATKEHADLKYNNG